MRDVSGALRTGENTDVLRVNFKRLTLSICKNKKRRKNLFVKQKFKKSKT